MPFPIILISFNADKVCLLIERVQFLLVPRDKITNSDEFQVRAVLKSERNSLRPGFGSFVDPSLSLLTLLFVSTHAPVEWCRRAACWKTIQS